MRRTIALVFGALIASTFFSTLAFLIAGKNTAFNYNVNSAYSQAEAIAYEINNNTDVSVSEMSRMFFGHSAITGRTLFIVDREGSIIFPTNYADIAPDLSSDVLEGLEYARNNMLDNTKDASTLEIIDKSLFSEKELVIQFKVAINGNSYYLLSISRVNENSEIINQYVNVLLLSALAAAFTMLLPVFLMVKHIVEPIQSVNEVAKAYGKGNYTIRADETAKGEVGELATSFNNMADKLSKSIDELTVERNRLEDIFNVITEGIVVFNENGNVTVSNNTMNELFAKVQKKNLFTERLQLIPFDEVWEDVDSCLATGVKKNRMVEGPDYSFQIDIIPKFDMNDPEHCIGATGFFRDVTDEQKLEKTRRDYVANISHELRTPLQTLRGLIEPLADGMVKNEEDKLRYYNIILNETLRLSRLIDDMLELSKLQSRTLAFKMFPFDLNSLLSDLTTKFMPVMREAGINFRVSFNTGKLPTVIGNPDRIEQILVILLDNAKKYTPEGGSITLSTEYSDIDKKVYVSVIDTGQGIHEYDINHIFDRFFKADRARGKKGTGLGLAIAKELLTYMGETITVQSEYGKGATFTFTLKKAVNNNDWY